MLITIPNVTRYTILPNKAPTKEETKPLEVSLITQDNCLILLHGSFIYGVTTEVPIFTNTRPMDFTKGKRYVFSAESYQIALVFESNVPQTTIDDLEDLMLSYGNLYFANDGVEPQWEDHDLVMASSTVDVEEAAQKGVKAKKSTSVKIANGFRSSGKLIKKGLLATGGFLVLGINYAGRKLKKAIGKHDRPVKVHRGTLKNLRRINKKTKIFRQFSSLQVQKVTTLAFDIGKKAARASGAQKVAKRGYKKIQGNRYYVPVKTVGKGVGAAALDIYTGLEEVSDQFLFKIFYFFIFC